MFGKVAKKARPLWQPLATFGQHFVK